MTKKELWKTYKALLEKKGIHHFEQVDINSSKAEILQAIKCLEASDEEMMKHLENLKNEYPNIYKTIIKTGNFLTHSHNRFYVFSF